MRRTILTADVFFLDTIAVREYPEGPERQRVFKDKLFIQTLGADGIRFKLGNSDWVKVAPVPCEKVADWEGAGDWTSATFIDFLCKDGCPTVKDMTEDLVLKGLEEAQKNALRSVGYLGSKGMIHAQMK